MDRQTGRHAGKTPNRIQFKKKSKNKQENKTKEVSDNPLGARMLSKCSQRDI